MIWFRVFATHQLRSSGTALIPHLPSPSTTLFFSRPCSHACTTATSQPFPYQSLPHSFHRNGGGAPSVFRRCASLPSSVHTSKFRSTQVFCLPLLRKHRGVGGFFPFWNSSHAVVTHSLRTGLGASSCVFLSTVSFPRAVSSTGHGIRGTSSRFCLEAPLWA
jgi:hypothetical protein